MKRKIPAAFALGVVGIASAFGMTMPARNIDAPASALVAEQQGYVVHLLPNDSGAGIAAEQDDFLEQLRSIDPDLVVAGRLTLTANALHLNMSADAAELARSLPSVRAVVPLQRPLSPPQTKLFAAETCQSSTKVRTGTDDITVAIVNTGVDYTHAALGGPGTKAAYQEAVANVRNPWDGFPTDVVVDGADFLGAMEMPFDRNPIDETMPQTATRVGEGTMVAGLIHRDAPHAKIRAYKVVTLVDVNGQGVENEFWDITGNALEYVVDPNRDGCTDDRADILVIPSSFRKVAHRAHYNEDDLLKEAVQASLDQLRAVAAHGVLVITDTGQFGSGGKFSLTYRATALEALSVGSALQSPEGMRAAPFNAHGPVRGAQFYLKPDMLADARDEVAVLGTGGGYDTVEHQEIAAARVAAMAANIMKARPSLSAADVKALLVNTANPQVLSADGSGRYGEVTEIGHGLGDMEAAMASPVVVYDADTFLPGLNFGFLEVQQARTLEKRLRLRNFDDEPHTYNIRLATHEGKASNAALSWDLPSSVTVPAGGSRVVTVKLRIDPAKLATWPFADSSDYSLEKWAQAELNGYLVFSPVANVPELRVAWLAKPRAAVDIEKHFDTVEEFFNSPFSEGFADSNSGTFELRQQFSNAGAKPATFSVYPLIRKVSDLNAEKRAPTDGNILRMVGGGIYDDERCEETGKSCQ